MQSLGPSPVDYSVSAPFSVLDSCQNSTPVITLPGQSNHVFLTRREPVSYHGV